MPYRNRLNMSKTDMDMAIYRIMPIQRILESVQKKKLTLVSPKKWDDPFENLLLNSTVVMEDGTEATLKDIQTRVRGQCWTTHRETDAMWRIYSADKSGARIKTTPRKLLQALKESDPQYGDIHCFIGRVQYLQTKDLDTKLKAIDLFNTDGSGIAESLMYKRREFRHESEIRVVYTNASTTYYSFKIDPDDLFESIVFDPRMDHELYQAYKLALDAKGFKNKIYQSRLYRPPEAMTIHYKG